MSIPEALTRTLNIASNMVVREAKDWLPASAKGQWSSRFKANESSSGQSFSPSTSGQTSSTAHSTASLPRFNPPRILSQYDNHDDDEPQSPSKSRPRSTYSRLQADIMIPRRHVTLTQKLAAALVGVWFVIFFITIFRGTGPQVDFDPLRNEIHNNRAIVSPTNANIYYVGRWSRNKAQGSATGFLVSTYFPGTYFDVRFTGTSLSIHLGNLDDPVTITVRIDNSNTYEILPYGREVVSLASSLPNGEHEARVLFSGARRTDIEALYVDKGKSLLPYVDKSHPKRRIVEVFQDTYNSSHSDVLSWSYLLTNKFDVDRVLISANDMCMSNCPNDIMALDRFYFLGSLSAARGMPKYWYFDEYRPSLMILDLGVATKRLIDKKIMYRLLLPQDASKVYSEAYMNFIRQIRKKVHKRVPILVLRPFDGSLETDSLQVVQTLRQQGDKNVHWIDTTSWATDALDNEAAKQEKRASFLSLHACPFLRPRDECQFLYPFEGKLEI
ncbi:hypothetical protein V1517DRAFT_327066 [Lipomyces orientalis]|uniref:Uncharacterized protein n=1 Tax=Lipomyces orientalis TaxID=1233043 RepID=A0ACC3TJ84_9ASCO